MARIFRPRGKFVRPAVPSTENNSNNLPKLDITLGEHHNQTLSQSEVKDARELLTSSYKKQSFIPKVIFSDDNNAAAEKQPPKKTQKEIQSSSRTSQTEKSAVTQRASNNYNKETTIRTNYQKKSMKCMSTA